MADIKPQKYLDPRPPETFAEYHAWSRTHKPGWVYDAIRMLATPIGLTIYRDRCVGVANIPDQGAFILAPNHFSNMDHFLMGIHFRRRIQFMGKSQLFSNAVSSYIFRVGGVFPVRRGRNDEEAFVTAHAILARGGCVGMYCEGGRSRSGELGEPKRGIGRLALESGAPVIPVAIHGSAGMRAWRRLRFPRITVQFGEAVSFPRVESPDPDQQLECARAIFGHVRGMYGVLATEGRAGAQARLRPRS